MSLILSENETWDFWKARNKAGKLLHGKYPQGWKIRVTMQDRNRNRFFYKRLHNPDLAAIHTDYPYFITATRYLGKNGKDDGYPYLKLLLTSTVGRTWTFSGWSDASKSAECIRRANRLCRTEINAVFECMEALKQMTTNDKMVQLVGVAKAKSLPMLHGKNKVNK
jgi:hypothetical protein